MKDAGIFAYKGDEQMRTNLNQMLSGGCGIAHVLITSDLPLLQIGVPGNKTRDFKKGEAWKEYERQWSILQEFEKTMPLAIARSPSDLEHIHHQGKVAVFISTEGGHMVEDDPSKLEQLWRDGVRRFQPIHYAKTKLGDSQSDPAYFGGLTPLGKAAIRKTRDLKMLLDAAHASYQTTKQMADIYGGPLILSHTLMKFNSPKYGSYHYDYPRFISEDHAHLIAQTGGIIGTWPLPHPIATRNEDAFVEAILRMTDEVGIDHVGWATDYLDSLMTGSSVFKSYLDFPKLCAKLLSQGFSDGDLVKFIGGNALRIQNEILN